MEYIRRMQLICNEKGDIEGTLREWGEVRISDHCVQTLLKIQAMTNTTQQAAECKIVRRSKFPGAGGIANQEISEMMRYG